MRDEPPNFPDQETLEKELSDYLSKKYGYRIKVISPMTAAEHSSEPVESEDKTGGIENIRFDMKPEEMSFLSEPVRNPAGRAKSHSGHKNLHPLQSDKIPPVAGQVRN